MRHGTKYECKYASNPMCLSIFLSVFNPWLPLIIESVLASAIHSNTAKLHTDVECGTHSINVRTTQHRLIKNRWLKAMG